MRFPVLAMALFLSACGGEALPPFTVTDVAINEPLPGMSMTSAYLTLRNNAATEIEITHVSSPDFEAVEIHESLLQDGVSKMREIENLIIPANSSVTLAPGGKHLMLMRRVGENAAIELRFYSGDAMLLSVKSPFTPRSN